MALCHMSGPGRPHLGFVLLSLYLVSAEPDAIHVSPNFGDGEEGLDDLPQLSIPTETKTVFGYQDFVTTVGNTVMVFTSKGAPENIPNLGASQVISQLSQEPTAALQLESLFLSLDSEKEPSPHKPFIEVHGNQKISADKEFIKPSSVLQTRGEAASLESGIVADSEDEPVFDLQSTQPGFTVEETFKLITSSDIEKPQSTKAYEESSENTIGEEPVEKKSKGHLKLNQRKSASNSFKERLRARLAKEKHSTQQISQRRSISNNELTDEPIKKSSEKHSKRSRTPRTRFRSSSRYSDDQIFAEHEQEEEKYEEKSGRAGFGSRNRRLTRTRSSSFRPRNKSKIREAIKKSTGSSEKSSSSESRSSFKPRKSFSTRNRFSNRGSSEKSKSTSIVTPEPVQEHAPEKHNSHESETKKPKITFKKFDRFKRPNRKNLLTKLFNKRPGLKTRAESLNEEEENAEAQNEVEFPDDHESSPSALVPSIIDDEDILQNIDNEEIIFERLQTTLEVSTLYPEESTSEYLEVATIRSPYSFNIEDNQKSTRFITVTRTFSKTYDIEPTSSFTSSVSLVLPTSSIKPHSTFKTESAVSTTPLFDTRSIPAPENILTSSSSPYSEIIEGTAAALETLPPLILASSLHQATPPLKTVTETLNTEDVMIKKSVLPIVVGSDTSLYTLSQTYSVTKHVTAIKTIPPMELYEFSPEQSFADFDNLFEEAGSENRESLLPGELEFSDQDNFGLDGPTEVRVQPPDGFLQDLALLGDKQDFINEMEKHNNPEFFSHNNQNNNPLIEPSFSSVQPTHETKNPQVIQQVTPSINLNNLGISPEQLLYLQLLQNPLAALGLGGGLQPQVITESSPVYKTEPIVETSVIKLFLGAKEFFTTLATTVGLTTKTDYVYSTRTVSGGLNGIGNLPALGGGVQLGQLGNQKQVVQTTQQTPQLGGGGILPSIKLVSSPITRDTVLTSTWTEEYKIRFRNQPTYTTVTSTKLVTTQVVSFVTKTEQVVPTVNPLAGLLG